MYVTQLPKILTTRQGIDQVSDEGVAAASNPNAPTESQELIKSINQYEADGKDLCELGEEVKLLAQSLIDAGDVTQALTLMGVYSEADWDNQVQLYGRGGDGFWPEHNQIVEILMQLGQQDALDNPQALFNGHKLDSPIFFRIGATINPNLQETQINLLLDEIVPYIGEEDMFLDEQFMLIALVFNKNLSIAKFKQTFELLDLEIMEHVLSIAQGGAYSWGSSFQHVQECLAKSKNIESGKKRILDYISNSDQEFLTPSIRYSEANCGSKENLLAELNGITRAEVEMLTALAKHDNQFVREAVAESLDTPSEILVMLSGDENETVRKAATGNPNYLQGEHHSE